MAIKTICDLFLRTVRKFPEKHLFFHKVQDRWVGISGNEILETVTNIAFSLLAKGVNPRENIAILSTNSPHWAMADYGIISMGAASVSVYPTLIPSQIEFILNDSESVAIFVEDQIQLQKIQEIRSKCNALQYIVLMDNSYNGSDRQICNWSEILESGKIYRESSNGNIYNIIKRVLPDDLLTLIYTSGTTGNPKGVMLSHHNMVSNILGVTESIKFLDSDIFLSFLPLSHSFERMGGHFTAFSKGATVYYAESIEKLTENMIEVRPTIMLSVPRLYEKMYARVLDNINSSSPLKKKLFWWSIDVGRNIVDFKINRGKPSLLLRIKYKIAKKLVFQKIKMKIGGRLRYFVSGGAPLSQEIAEFFAAADVVILEGYGLSETSPVLTANTPEFLRFGTVGKPLNNVKIKIAFDGEILVKGPNIMMGYFNNPDATDEVLNDGWFATGDIGELDSDGYLIITDRKKNILVTSGGKNIAPAPIESALVNSMYIEQAVVIGDRRNFISALIVPNFEYIGSYLDSREITISDPEAVIEHPVVTALIDAEVESAMSGFAQYEKVKKYQLIPNLFTIERGELTPSMKIVRKVVINNYYETIELMYSEGKEKIEHHV